MYCSANKRTNDKRAVMLQAHTEGFFIPFIIGAAGTAASAAGTAVSAVKMASTAYSVGTTAYSVGSAVFGTPEVVSESTVTAGIGSMFALSMMSWGAKHFLAQYGTDMFKGLYSTFMDGVASSPASTTTAAEPTPKKKKQDSQGGWWQWASGNTKKEEEKEEEAPRITATAAEANPLERVDNRALLAGVSAITLAWLQYVGASEMKVQVMKRIKKSNAANINTDQAKDEALMQWRKRKQIDSSQRDIVYYDRVMDEGLSAKDDGSKSLSDVLTESIYQLYHDIDYYKGQKNGLFSSLTYFNPREVHAARMLLNLLLGMMLQLDFIFSRSGSGDPLKTFSNFLLLTGYTEILCRALRKHGWAPLYVAATAVDRLLHDTRRI